MLRHLVVAVVLLAACHRGEDAPKPKPRALEPLTCRALDGCTSGCADAACAEACTRRLTDVARPVYEALQACVVPACANRDGGSAPCLTPGSFSCKACVLAHCAAQASRCMAN
jgi:hypothetical protein